MSQTTSDIKRQMKKRLGDFAKLIDELKTYGDDIGQPNALEEVFEEIGLFKRHSNIIYKDINLEFIKSIRDDLYKVGVWPISFYHDCEKSGLYTIFEYPLITMKPKLLIVESYSAADAVLLDIRCANYHWNLGNKPIPLSLFTPITWGNAELMAKILIELPVATPAHRVNINIHVQKPIKFSAVIFGIVE